MGGIDKYGAGLRTCCLMFLIPLGLVALSVLTSSASAQVPDLEVRPWNRDVIYFVMTDRFRDGDTTNNQPLGSDPLLYDASQQDINKYHGGDLRGLELAIQENYFNDLGVTAIWITPPVKNAWNSSFDLGGAKTGYHGYWAQDFLDIDPHLVSRTAMDGAVYSNSRDGRMQHYKDFVSLAHRHNIKVVQDIVCNHVGPLFYYDVNSNGVFDINEGYEWIAPYRQDGFYDSTAWADVPRWNLQRTQPAERVTILGRPIDTSGILQKLETYGRKGFSPDSLGKSDGEEVKCDFFALRDLWTSPDSTHFDTLVNEFVEIYAFYIQHIGVDGLRIDTVKHADHEFWDAFTARLRHRIGTKKASRLLLFGEVYDGNPHHLGAYTYRKDFPDNKSPCLDSLLNFQFCFCLRDYLRVKGATFGSPGGLQRMMEEMNSAGTEAIYNATPGGDGLSARQKMVNFFENHDGINRFLVDGVALDQHLLALSIAMTVEGVPCLYYGSEVPLQDEQGSVGRDGETGRLTYCLGGRGEYLAAAKQSVAFRTIKALTDYRQQFPALHSGRMVPLWVDSDQTSADDGIFVFARYLQSGEVVDPQQTVLVVVNARPEQGSTTESRVEKMRLTTPDGQPLVAPNTTLKALKLPSDLHSASSGPPVVIDWVDGIPHVNLQVPPRTVRLLMISSD